ncbi:MAG TPA: NADH-ubiquinone oxidoreductase-F iron-sulfur binding region domain-containing protein [Planctomycetaceae bacterium]|nr:NADH-ubiquinone oxidoreductase-F iron-sulfur binding region domain-containing protein [Planctomycetaceae bacterium]
MHPSVPQPETRDPQIATALERAGRSPDSLLPVLQMLNRQRGGLSDATVRDVSRAMNVPAERVEGVATFYSLLSRPPQAGRTIRVCDGLTCWLNGATECRQALEQHAAERRGWRVTRSSCLGLCDRAPAALVEDRQCGPIAPDGAGDVVDGWTGAMPTYGDPLPGEARFTLARGRRIDPWSIDEALAAGAYSGLRTALSGSQGAVIEAIETAGLTGRGGAGFPTARKWRMVAEAPDGPRFVICNADESEPLTFKDRVLMESDPHAVLEGMAVCGYAVGAAEGIVYIRGEYEPQARLLEAAIGQAVERGWLGGRIAGSGFSFHVHVHRGAGAYICGEETALLESLEGRRGEPRIRPPYPAAHGFRGQPTVVNNVETLATAAAILAQGAEAWRATGLPEAPGTRLFTLQGHIRRSGLVELPCGLTLRQIIDTFGGGMRPGSRFQFALTGGAAGTFVSGDQLDVPLGPAARQAGIAIGSGGILVCDESVSPVAVLREALHFFEQESCGKCTPCRIGTAQARRTLDRLLSGDGDAGDLRRLDEFARLLRNASFCGLGTSAADPIRTARERFPDEFERLVSR